ncbi:MAG: septum formation initiator family protein [Bryobacteraceae bacterium]|nr:septum formation initiator family protein [Bryobacteraceae bacterium]
MLSSPNPALIRRISYSTFALIALAFVLLFFKGPQGLPAFQAKWAHVQATEKSNAALKQEIEAMREKNYLLRTDQEAIRVAIREELGKQSKGEVTYKVEKPKP